MEVYSNKSQLLKLDGELKLTTSHVLHILFTLIESRDVYTTKRITTEKKLLGLKILYSEAYRDENSSVWHKTIYLFGIPVRKTKFEGHENSTIRNFEKVDKFVSQGTGRLSFHDLFACLR